LSTLVSLGDAVAEHRVELDPAAWEFEAFTELYSYLRRYAVPNRRLKSERQLVWTPTCREPSTPAPTRRTTSSWT